VLEDGKVRELTQAGLATARARGRKGGRPRTLAARQLELARSMLAGDLPRSTERGGLDGSV